MIKRKAISLVEMSVTLVLLAVISASLAYNMGRNRMDKDTVSAAFHLESVAESARLAISQKIDTIAAAVKDMNVNDRMLVNLAGDINTDIDEAWRSSLPTGQSLVGPLGHHYSLLIKKSNSENRYEAMVVGIPDGSKEIDASSLAYILNHMGPSGGISTDGSSLSGLHGLWNAPSTSWHPNITAGSIASYLVYDRNGTAYASLPTIEEEAPPPAPPPAPPAPAAPVYPVQAHGGFNGHELGEFWGQNIARVEHHGLGHYKVVFQQPFPNGNYSVMVSQLAHSGERWTFFANVVNRWADAFIVNTGYVSGTKHGDYNRFRNPDSVMFMVIR